MSRQEDRKFIRNFIVVIGGLVVTAVVLAIIAATLYDGNTEERRQFTAERAAQNLQPVGQVRLTGEAMPEIASSGGQEEASSGPRSGEEVVNQVCAACHQSGTLGAPKIGDKAAWSPRVEKGMKTLLTHASNGFNNMPPQKGSASEEEIRKAIQWMVDQAGLTVQ
ncbi:c-type cytochrome [Arhodomonas aquaeolei]|uniref:c-type cytochrome n=1 Tax=Arhodomonas aquaeolei TaxID=2369 RepID=UPI00037434D1|nr:c-type cytochrome [Arhodomonas aquaeolei]